MSSQRGDIRWHFVEPKGGGGGGDKKRQKRPAAKDEKQHTPKCKKRAFTTDVETLLASAKSKLLGESEDYSGPMGLEDCLAFVALPIPHESDP